MKNQPSNIHPELVPAAKFFPRVNYNQKNLWLVNAVMRMATLSKAPQGIRVENVRIPGPDHRRKIRVRIYSPQSVNGRMPALIWMHGGGFIMGNPEQDDGSCAHYVRELGLTVVSVDYRLGPKNPFPAGLEDCYTALQWTASQAQQLGIDEKRIAIGGASAGGGLAAALAHLTQDRSEITPVFQLLVYPMLDDQTMLRSDLKEKLFIAWTPQSNQYGWEAYLGAKCGTETIPAYAVPARRMDLTGLPPAWIGVGTEDLFYEEDFTYAQRLRENGVDCEFVTVEGAFHGFDVMQGQLQIVRDFRQSQISALRKYCFE